MNLNTSARFCSRCHSYSHFPTYEEWLESEHGHAEVDCVICHDPMSLELVVEDTNDLCGKCHEDLVKCLQNGTHGFDELDCIDCHMVKSFADFESDDISVTGHTFIPGVPDPNCTSCHEVNLEAHNVWAADYDNCLTCHDSIYMTMLHLLNGTELAMSESSILCKQCHNDMYYEWEMGIHAEAHASEKGCPDCHYPMNPYIMMNATLPPISQPSQETVIKAPIPPVALFGALAIVSGLGLYTYFSRRGYGGFR
jgi:uncharacterized CHY-type Zn-finger protein